MAQELSNTNNSSEPLDETDQRLLGRLMRQGRATWADLAVELGLTAPAIAQRVRRLEDRGVIVGFAALASAGAVAPVCAWVTLTPGVRGAGADNEQKLRRHLAELDWVQECHDLGAEYLVKVRCGSLSELRSVVAGMLPKAAGGVVTSVRVVLSTLKESPVMPLTPPLTAIKQAS